MFSRLKFAAALAAALAACATGASAQEMQFRVVSLSASKQCGKRCPWVVVAQGELAADTAEAFVSYMRGVGKEPNFKRIVLIHSPGGIVLSGVSLGLAFRQMGFSVMVARMGETPDGGRAIYNGRCASACIFALMGGKRRIVPAESIVAVHRVHADAGVDVANSAAGKSYNFATSEFVTFLRRYTSAMGVRTEVIDIAESVAPQDSRRLSPAELSRFRLGSAR